MPATLAGPRPREVFEREGTPRPAGSDRPLLLEGGRVWWVEAGRVDVFSLPVEGVDGHGTRTHLFRAAEGQLLVGVGGAGPTPPVGLLAVGGAGTRLRELPAERLRELARTPDGAAGVGELVDGWVDALCEAMARGSAPGPCAELEPGETDVQGQQRVRPRGGVGWVRHPRGRPLLLGRDALALDAGAAIPVPLSRRIWMEVPDGARLQLATTAEVIGDDEGWQGLDRLHALVLDWVQLRMEEAVRTERERLRQRAVASRRAFAGAFTRLASTLQLPGAATPRMRLRADGEAGDPTDHDVLFAACRLVAEALDIPLAPPPPGAGVGERDPLAALARANHFRTRMVLLRDGWWRQDGGPLLGQAADDGRPLALVPVPRGGYLLHDPLRRTVEPVTEAVADTLAPQAQVFYRHFGDEALSLAQVLRFGLHGARRDAVVVVALAAAAGLLGLLTPIATGWIFNDIVPGAERTQLLQLVLVLLAIATSTALLNFTGGIALLRIEGRMSGAVQGAVWDRLLQLPLPFFRDYSAGDLATRAMSIDAIRRVLSGATVHSLLGGIFSLFHLVLLFHYSATLAVWAVGLIALAMAASCLVSWLQLRHQHTIAQLHARISGSVLQFLTSISKLRVSGAEVHAFALWAEGFARQRRLQFRVETLGNGLAAFNAAFPVASALVIYAVAAPLLLSQQGEPMRTGDFLAFMTAFTSCVTGVLTATGALLGTLQVIPLYEQARPILETPAEVQAASADPGSLSGEIEVQHLAFRYRHDGPPVLRDLSLHIRPGEFVALVGPSGSGKSTILRLLLGFERPESGTIHFDGQDLSGLDVRAVRGQIGVVLQNGQLMPGDIFTNIVGSAPLTVDDAWEAARMAGLEADIRAMPMGMHTVISEGGGNLSGGQRQRLMIARALVRRPRILFFDEATSALDNRTQAIVSESLTRLHATRVVVAHRLSTIRDADRIYVLEAGRIVEAGGYDALMQHGGLFAQLALRQLA